MNDAQPTLPIGDRWGSSPSPVTVLVVESGEQKVGAIRAALERGQGAALRVVHAGCLADALDRLEGRDVQLVLLDLALADGRGLSGLHRLQLRAPEVPVIVLVDAVDEAGGAAAVRGGAQSYVTSQDLDHRVLGHAIRNALERHRVGRVERTRDERFALAMRGSDDGVWDWDLEADTIFRCARWNAMLGYPDADEAGPRQSWFDLVHADDLPLVQRLLEAHLGGASPSFECEHRIRDGRGEYRWVLSRGRAVRTDQGQAYRMAGTMVDISERKAAERRLRHSALHDPLTGLANRILLVDRIDHAIASQHRPGRPPFALLYFDLDRFKEINDTLGHLVGDKLLVGIASRLRELLRPGDTVARLGGDEFAVLLGEVAGVEGATQVAERVLRALDRPFLVDGREVETGASMGVALGSGDYSNAEKLVRDADLAMYRAKSMGRGRFQVFDSSMHRSTAALLKMESELRQAVESQQFEVHYQPIVTLTTGRIVGFEALVRWQHPERGLIPPRQFLAIAEETGLIVPIGWWVLREACRQAQDWHLRFPFVPPLTMSVNVSGKVFMQDDMVGKLIEILQDTGFAPEALRLELTENVFLDQGDAAFLRLLELRALGVHSSIDDFGTGYSSLSCLQRSQCESLKIDPAFVGAIDRVGSSDTLVQSIVHMAGSMGISVIAEGVETAEQAHRLRGMQCPQGQGYWFAKPLAPLDAERLLASPPSW